MKQAVQEFMNNVMEAIASVRAGFVFAFFAMLAQVTHIWLLVYESSSFDGFGAAVQAWILAISAGGGLLFFTIRAGNTENPELKAKYMKTTNGFAIFEAYINLYYWLNHFVFVPGFKAGTFDWSAVSWYKLTLVIPLAIAVPIILKQFAGEIKLKSKEETSESNVNSSRFDEIETQLSIVNRQMGEISEDFKKYIDQMEEKYNDLDSKFFDFTENQNKLPRLADFSQVKQDLEEIKQNKSNLPPAQDLPKPRRSRTN